jgi:hypothetical protein
MLLGEILIEVVFAAALMTAVACLIYLVYATLLERRLLRSRRTPAFAGASPTASSPVKPSRVTAAAGWRRGAGASAFPVAKH